jgi:hypothetical protein
MKRLFLATAKGDDPLRVAEWRAAIAALVPNVTIVDGVEDWTENFHRCGGWNGWAQDVATGRDINGRHRFDIIVCPHIVVGKATAQIVDAALRMTKPVFHVRRDGEVARVVTVAQEDPESWKAGWVLVTDPPTS